MLKRGIRYFRSIHAGQVGARRRKSHRRITGSTSFLSALSARRIGSRWPRFIPPATCVVVLLTLAIAATASPAFALGTPAPQATGALHALELGTTAALPPPVSAAVKSSG